MKVIVKGQLVNYNDEGSGKILLLLHGWGQNLQTFDGLFKHLTSKHRVIRLDFPGFGESPKPPDAWHVEDYAYLVASFITKLKLAKVDTIIGHSFGGRVILKGVGNNIIDAERVILIDTAGIKPKPSLQKRLFNIASKGGKRITALPGFRPLQNKLRKNLYQMAGSTDYLEANEMRQIFINVINEDLQVDAAKISKPTLLLWGQDDDVTPVSDAERLHVLIDSSKLVIISGAGHFVYSDQPEEALHALEEFLK